MKKYIIIGILLCTVSVVKAQNCDCESNFDWVKKTFEENDAGFEYYIEKKGKQAYQEHNGRILTKVKSAKIITDCTPILYEWLQFFRSGHVSISLKEAIQYENVEKINAVDYSNWEKLVVDLPKFEKYLKNKKEQDAEGIWISEPYKIGIKKEGNQYVGFIIESGAETWQKNQVKLKMASNLKSSVFYMRDHSSVESNDIQFLGENYLKIGRMLLQREYPILPKDEKIETYITMLSTNKPYLDRLNSKTLMLRIPSFSFESKTAIDSVLATNKDLILRTENLILDIRNGTGGSDGSFKELLPYLYTNPIRTVGVQFRSTKLNNQRMLQFINDPKYGFDEEDKKWAQAGFDKLEMNLGKYIGLNQYDINLTSLDTVYEFPKNIAIIINGRNGSTDEQFLLAAKQSKKVKLYGKPTFGVLDISNMYFVDSPCNEFELGYALSRSKRIPDFPIDEIGIQPDYYLDEDIPEEEWISYVNELINQ